MKLFEVEPFGGVSRGDVAWALVMAGSPEEAVRVAGMPGADVVELGTPNAVLTAREDGRACVVRAHIRET